MTLESLLTQIGNQLRRTGQPVDIGTFVAGQFPHDMEAGRLLVRAFDARLLKGRLHTNFFDFEGRIIGIADDTRPVWH